MPRSHTLPKNLQHLTKPNRHWKAQDAKDIISQWQASGAKLDPWCKAVGLDARKVRRWRKRVSGAPSSAPSAEVSPPPRTTAGGAGSSAPATFGQINWPLSTLAALEADESHQAEFRSAQASELEDRRAPGELGDGDQAEDGEDGDQAEAVPQRQGQLYSLIQQTVTEASAIELATKVRAWLKVMGKELHPAVAMTLPITIAAYQDLVQKYGLVDYLAAELVAVVGTLAIGGDLVLQSLPARDEVAPLKAGTADASPEASAVSFEPEKVAA